MNPVILLDEIDKVSSQSGLRADLMAALLEVLDPNQNHSFTDRYIDYPVDLSQVLFITTANNLKGISAALLDRLEVIRFHSYTDKEKQVIAKQYLMPKVREKTGITSEQLAIEEDTWELLIRPLGFDPGIRQLERNLTNLCRKVAKMIVEGQVGKVVITRENFRDFFPEQIAVMS
jgi:ATP-dependent Lon protease